LERVFRPFDIQLELVSDLPLDSTVDFDFAPFREFPYDRMAEIGVFDDFRWQSDMDVEIAMIHTARFDYQFTSA
jgi:hypothetical protein